MELLIAAGILVGGLVLLLKGADFFVDGAETVGLSFGIPPFIIGVTIIAFGTSLPELASSVASIYQGTSEIVLSGVLGSNITNITLVLATVAVIGKNIPLDKNILRVDIPMLVISSLLLFFVASDRAISVIEAVLLLLSLVVFLVYSLQSNDGNTTAGAKADWKAYALLVVGAVMVYFGAEWTIEGINKLSAIAGINQDIVGLSLLALATSLPELIVSIAAARKGKTEIAVGNVLGSNVFNTYAVVGIARLFGDLKVTDNIVEFSLPFAVAITIIFAFSCLSKGISRWEGLMYLLLYGFFLVDLFKGVM
ncbi:MAG: calcium/sodium antiporter [Bacteroidota bacterium]